MASTSKTAAIAGDLLVNIVRCILVHPHIASGFEDQRGSLVVAQHQLALELCKAFVLIVKEALWRWSVCDGSRLE